VVADFACGEGDAVDGATGGGAIAATVSETAAVTVGFMLALLSIAGTRKYCPPPALRARSFRRGTGMTS
jgi:hypothetical protein